MTKKQKEKDNRKARKQFKKAYGKRATIKIPLQEFISLVTSMSSHKPKLNDSIQEIISAIKDWIGDDGVKPAENLDHLEMAYESIDIVMLEMKLAFESETEVDKKSKLLHLLTHLRDAEEAVRLAQKDYIKLDEPPGEEWNEVNEGNSMDAAINSIKESREEPEEPSGNEVEGLPSFRNLTSKEKEEEMITIPPVPNSL